MQMATARKPRRTWLYVSDDDQERLEKILAAVQPHMNEATVLSVLASSGLKACERAGNRLPLPLGFEIVDPDPPLKKARQ
jgi:hypothetical protein